MTRDIFEGWKKSKVLESPQPTEDDPIRFLNGEGATNAHYKGTSIVFDYKGLVVDLMDQESRVVGRIHKKPTNDLERQCLEDAPKVFRSGNPNQIEGMITNLNYRAFVFGGKFHSAILDVLELARMPIEKVIELYKIGYTDSGSYGPIRAVGATWARAGVNPHQR
ncbi:hypothetical protein HYX04_00995 [Candidatus Woesearchaeota archaeon]|nr:hypothetical protein [Candidatus Woesearchaeota archaeon]